MTLLLPRVLPRGGIPCAGGEINWHGRDRRRYGALLEIRQTREGCLSWVKAAPRLLEPNGERGDRQAGALYERRSRLGDAEDDLCTAARRILGAKVFRARRAPERANSHRRWLRACAHLISCPVFFQSARKVSRPLSVRGCLARFRSTAGGIVAASAPAIAACLTWRGVRIEEARISVLNDA